VKRGSQVAVAVSVAEGETGLEPCVKQIVMLQVDVSCAQAINAFEISNRDKSMEVKVV